MTHDELAQVPKEAGAPGLNILKEYFLWDKVWPLLLELASMAIPQPPC